MTRFAQTLLLIFVLFTTFFIQCKPDLIFAEELNISNISILLDDNEELLSDDFFAQENDGYYTIQLSSELKDLPVTFTILHNGDSLKIGTERVYGEKIETILKDEISIEIAKANGKTKDIVLKVEYFDDLDLVIKEIKLLKSLNPSLPRDIVLTSVDNKTYTGVIPQYTSKDLILSFDTNARNVFVDTTLQISGVTVNNFSNEVLYKFITPGGVNNSIKIKLNVLGITEDHVVPHIIITTENTEEITSKEIYLMASMYIDGKKGYPDFYGTTQIRGRGNSTWKMEKKPYRLRLPTKGSVLGLPEARNWVLLANYIDPSLMCNIVAMKIGRDLNVPYTNTMIPVDLTINGEYRGSYVLTQQIEVHENRVNISDDGYLIELDSYFDEDYQFYSANYTLPVMIKSPDLNNESELLPIKREFEALESLIKESTFPNNSYKDYFDINAFAKYILVCFITANEEINHPKSIYMHKRPGGKFTFGPLWDFDWAYGYDGESSFHFMNPTKALFWNTHAGAMFFKRLFEDPAVKTAFKNEWVNYKVNHLSDLYVFIDQYAARIKSSKQADYNKWRNNGADFDNEVARMKTYLQQRATYIDSYIQGF
jgi:hypothetical protein